MTPLDDFERSNRLDVARAVRDGRLSPTDAGQLFLDRAMRRLARLEAKEKRDARESQTREEAPSEP
jgi:DNA-binding transcriptional LysR family regulator